MDGSRPGLTTTEGREGLADALLAAPDRGTGPWWDRVAAVGTPLVAPIATDRSRVTFLWRHSEAIDRVYIDVNGITDHHAASPQTLTRIDGTDIGWWQVDLPTDWRGSYAFLPATSADRPPSSGRDVTARRAQRTWWRRLASGSLADPINPLAAYRSGWGGWASPLHLPDAPDQGAWRAFDRGAGHGAPTTRFVWKSATLGIDRTVWSHVTGASRGHARPLVLLLDGRTWVERLPIAPVLDAETAARRLPPAHYLLVDSIAPEQRERDLRPNADFWSAIWDELLPLADAIVPVCPDRAGRIIAGQSYGGLAALYAVLDRPGRWGGAIAQSASLWWPDPALVRGRTRRPGAVGGLAARLRAGAFPPGRARVFLEVGSCEDAMIDLADTMHAALIAAGHDSHFRLFAGGHDALCWRGGLIDGLRLLLGTSRSTDAETER